MLDLILAGSVHEGLSYFGGNLGQFCEVPTRFSIIGQVRKRNKKLQKEKELEIKKKKEEEKRKKHEDNMNQLLKQQQDLEGREELKPIFEKIRKLNPKILRGILFDNRIL